MDDILDTVSATEKPLVLLTGLAGTGRTTLLTRFSDRCEAEGRHVSAMRFTSAGDVVPARFSGSPDVARTDAVTVLRGPVRTEPAWATIGPVTGAAGDPAVARRAAHAAAAALRRAGDTTVLLLDDLQWIDRDSLAVLEALIRMRVKCVGTLRVPAIGAAARFGPEVLARLRGEDLVDTLRLPPLNRRRLANRLAGDLGAVPEPELVDHVHSASRGVPAVLDDVVDALHRRGAIRVVDRSAYLVADTSDRPVEPGRCVNAVRELGDEAWEAAKALALLAPLGDAAPQLAGEVIGVPASEVLRRCDVLRAAGVLHRGGPGAGWRFPIPHVATALAAACGPYERRVLAAAAVTALWAGTASCADPVHRKNLVAAAGRLVAPARASSELLHDADDAGVTDSRSALRRIAAAAELAGDPARRAEVLLLLATTYDRYGDHERTRRTVRSVLADFPDVLDPEAALEAGVLLVRASSGLRDTPSLRSIAAGETTLARDPAVRTTIRALACGMLDRWADAERWSDSNEALSRNGHVRAVNDLIQAASALWQGRAGLFERGLAHRENWSGNPRLRAEQVDTHLAGLLLNGELGQAEDLLAAEGLSWDQTRPANQVMAMVLQGEFRFATGLACRAVAVRSAPSFSAATTGMFHAAVTALVSQGRLTTARELLTAAERTNPVLAHLLDFTEAQLARTLGDARGAAERLTIALDSARSHGLVVGCDVAYAELADLALELGEHDTAEACLSAVERLARVSPSGRTTLLARFVRAAVAGDEAAGVRSLRLARDRGQPFELSVLITRLVKHGVADPPLLSEAYELMGQLGALFHRAETRTLMQKHGVVVPGRRNTLAENERLLATLAAEGLGNKQIAAALMTSEKSVEGRMSRLFTRTGYRSRIELSTAMASGELDF
ncbi:AAA family ATPase [Amycolatopsis sp. lyj-23]|uniref:helix-turn-helix transcriptional regulator n=1 Tax=Amycolatopsis sp. lyj-23 TaxID=2789283 RepID=UPI00397CF823